MRPRMKASAECANCAAEGLRAHIEGTRSLYRSD
jgi:hypothetical protein